MDSVVAGRHAAAMSEARERRGTTGERGRAEGLGIDVAVGERRSLAANENESATRAAFADPYVLRALSAMKADPARRWTVATLARVAGLSRAPFARRFRDAQGTSPMSWLAQHRVGLAQTRVLQGGSSLAAIALEVGYSSEFALSKAFKRLVGVAPRPYRRLATEQRHDARAVRAVRAIGKAA